LQGHLTHVLQPFRRNTLLKCAPSPKVRKNIKTPYFRNSRSFNVINDYTIKSWSLVLVMISSMSVPIFNCFHARRGNTGKISTF